VTLAETRTRIRDGNQVGKKRHDKKEAVEPERYSESNMLFGGFKKRPKEKKKKATVFGRA